MSLSILNFIDDTLDSQNTVLWSESNGWSNGGVFANSWKDTQIIFTDGIMQIKLDEVDGSLVSGEYRSNDTYGYGNYGISLKASNVAGTINGFFTYTGPSEGTRHDEIDIEIKGDDPTKIQVNYWTDGVEHPTTIDLGFDASAAFHTYAFLWQEDKIEWFVDGTSIHIENGSRGVLPTNPGKIMTNLWGTVNAGEWSSDYNISNGSAILDVTEITYSKLDTAPLTETPINFQHTSLLSLDTIQSEIDSADVFLAAVGNIINTGTLTKNTSTTIIYTDGSHSLSYFGRNLNPSSLPTTTSITKIIYHDSLTGQTMTIKGLIKYKFDEYGNKTMIDNYATTTTYTVPCNGKIFSITISATKLSLDNTITDDITKYSYVINDGHGGMVSIKIPLMTVDMQNTILTLSTLKEQIDFFNNSNTLSANDVLSIRGSTELFLDVNGNSHLNGYAGNDILTGSSEDDILDGGLGIDTMIGGYGNDTYYVDHMKDKVTETSKLLTEIDTVISTINYVLGRNVENLNLIGTAIKAVGNTLANTLTGNDENNIIDGKTGNDTLIGGGGNDILSGDAGADVFVFNTALNIKTNIDMITDFTSGEDTLQLSKNIFKAVAREFTSDNFIIGTQAIEKNDYLIYDQTEGKLYYDADGNAKGAAIQIAVLGLADSHPIIACSDFSVS